MHKKILSIALIAVFVLLLSATVVFAYNSVQGQVIDSKNGDPWTYGGEVWVYDTQTGDVCATGVLDANGNFSLSFGTNADDGLNQGTTDCTQSTYNGHTFEILIDFNCSTNTGACNPPSGTPGTSTTQFAQNSVPVTYDAGYIETGTGPTAVTISDVQVGTSTARAGLPFAAAAGIAALGAGAVTLLRRRRRDS